MLTGLTVAIVVQYIQIIWSLRCEPETNYGMSITPQLKEKKYIL